MNKTSVKGEGDPKLHSSGLGTGSNRATLQSPWTVLIVLKVGPPPRKVLLVRCRAGLGVGLTPSSGPWGRHSVFFFWLSSQKPWACLGWAFRVLHVCMTAPLLEPAANSQAWLLFSNLVKTQNAFLQDQSARPSTGPLARQGLSLTSALPSPTTPAKPGKGCQRGASANTPGTQRPKARSTRTRVICLFKLSFRECFWSPPMMRVTGRPGAQPRGKLQGRMGLGSRQLRELGVEMERVGSPIPTHGFGAETRT